MKKLTLALIFSPSLALAANNSPLELIIGVGGMAIVVVIVLVFAAKANEGVADSENLNFADADSLHAKLMPQLDSAGAYNVSIVRQSGNIERTIQNVDADQVVKQIAATMRRSKMDAISISGDEDQLHLYRVLHNGRGRQEGKRIGGFEVRKVSAFNTKMAQESSKMSEPSEAEDVDLEFNFAADTEAKKAIIKAFFSVPLEDDQIPDPLLDNFDPESGSGSAILDASDLITLLVVADLHLSGVVAFTDSFREQFRSSDTLWQRQIGEDESIKEITGICGFGSTTPKDIKEEFNSFWDICELFVGFDSEDPSRQQLNALHRLRMEQSRPKILDIDF